MKQLEDGVLNKNLRMQFTKASDTTGVLDADKAPGIVPSDRAMEEAMAIAEKHGSDFVAVRDSNHFGYAGYRAKKAMDGGFVGISMSNGGPRMTVTYGTEPIFGTNPFQHRHPRRT